MIDLVERIEMMTRNVIMGGIHHDIWSLHIHQTTWAETRIYREHLAELWSATSLAHRYSFYVRLSAAYQENPKANSIPQLFREISPRLDQPSRDQVVASLAIARPTAKKIELLRNNVYAHQSRRRSVKDVYGEAGITLDEGAQLVSISIDILNGLRRPLGLNDCSMGRRHIEEFGRVIAAAQSLKLEA